MTTKEKQDNETCVTCKFIDTGTGPGYAHACAGCPILDSAVTAAWNFDHVVTDDSFWCNLYTKKGA